MKIILKLLTFLILALTHPTFTKSVLHPQDFLALQSVRSSLHDLPGSTFFSTWDFTSDPCTSFSGVLCSADRVISLSLGSPAAGVPGLFGRLPSSLSLLSALHSLSLVPGRVSGQIPPSLSSLSNLRFLALSHNLLSGHIPPSLSSLVFLSTLDLSFNLLSGPVPCFPALTTLILNHNQFTGPLKSQRLSNQLIRLDLKQNQLSGEIPDLPRSLTYLSLSWNKLSGRIDFLSKLPNLNHLDLGWNRLTGSIPGIIFYFPIHTIYMQKNLLEGPIRGVEKKVGVREVDLSYNRLSGKVPEGLAGAERVYLNMNRFAGEVPKVFGEKVRRGEIRVLYLQRNYLTGMDVGAVPGSVSLCLSYNCMKPPDGMVCPVRRGRWKRRPESECARWRKRIEL